MKPIAALAALTLVLGSAAAPALARDSFVIDNAHMLSAAAVQRINQKAGDFSQQTGKEVVVDTEPSLNGATLAEASERVFAQQQVNGVLIYIAKSDQKIQIVGDRASRAFFPSGSFSTIYQAMRPSFAAGNFDEGVTTAVDLVINQYRSHEGSLNRARNGRPAVPAGTRTSYSSSGGSSMGWIWWLIILAVIFFVIRGIFRAIAGPRMYPPGYGGGPMGGPGYGPGYGGGYGGGGGGFWSGMLGGLGGAFLGNELFGNRGGNVVGGDGGSYAGVNDPGAAQDAGGWQSDAGQADMSNAGGGGWGDSGGGWGGGDSGGGWGGGDSGGGGGDGGGGW